MNSVYVTLIEISNSITLSRNRQLNSFFKNVMASLGLNSIHKLPNTYITYDTLNAKVLPHVSVFPLGVATLTG